MHETELLDHKTTVEKLELLRVVRKIEVKLFMSLTLNQMSTAVIKLSRY